MQNYKKLIFSLLLSISCTNTTGDSLVDFFNHFICGFGRKIGDNTGQYVWDNYKKETLITVGLGIAFYVIHKKYTQQKQKSKISNWTA